MAPRRNVSRDFAGRPPRAGARARPRPRVGRRRQEEDRRERDAPSREYSSTCAQGNAKYAARDFDGAIALYRKAIERSPHQPLGLLPSRGGAARGRQPRRGRGFLGVARPLEAGEKDPALQARILFVTADLKERQKKWEDAKAAWQTYLDWANRFPDAGVFPASAQSREAVLDTVIKQDKAYEIVRQRIAASQDGGVFSDSVEVASCDEVAADHSSPYRLNVAPTSALFPGDRVQRREERERRDAALAREAPGRRDGGIALGQLPRREHLGGDLARRPPAPTRSPNARLRPAAAVTCRSPTPAGPCTVSARPPPAATSARISTMACVKHAARASCASGPTCPSHSPRPVAYAFLSAEQSSAPARSSLVVTTSPSPSSARAQNLASRAPARRRSASR